MSKRILYIGGFELPDRNAAAQRVVGISKGLRELGNTVFFLNSIKKCSNNKIEEKRYFGFKCFEYKRESAKDYLFSAKTALSMIETIKPNAIIAYNYPAFALERIRRYCIKNNIKCFADVTEWYQAVGGNFIYRLIKNIDTSYRMRVVQKKLDGVIAISRFLYDYYKDELKTVLIPPTVDMEDEKWRDRPRKTEGIVSFVYAGVPILLKEKLGTIVLAIKEVARDSNVVLRIIGVTEQQFIEMYNWDRDIPESVKFLGRVEHLKVVQIVKDSDWAIILREDNQVVKAGFPTKLVESISCGTPVIINRFSNVADYINESNGILCEESDELVNSIKRAINHKCTPDRRQFDYHNYLVELEAITNQ